MHRQELDYTLQKLQEKRDGINYIIDKEQLIIKEIAHLKDRCYQVEFESNDRLLELQSKYD